MKFHEMGLLTARKAGNRVFYRVVGLLTVGHYNGFFFIIMHAA